jgi:hypoxanthine phosphoribosyltransferase
MPDAPRDGAPGGACNLRALHSAAEVDARIREIGQALRGDLGAQRPLFLAIAEGARRFAERLADLFAELATPAPRPQLVYLRAARTRGTQLDEVQLEPLDPAIFAGRDVLVIDDIADEGRTLQATLALVRRGRPRSLRTAVLVDKRGRRKHEVPLDYVGFEVKDGWVVGFGMDLDGRYRELDELAVVEGTD